MFQIRCSCIAKSINPEWEKVKGVDDIVVTVASNDPNINETVAKKCMPFFTTSFMKFFPDQVGNFIAHEYYQNYTLTISDQEPLSITYHTIDPSLFELSASKIAHYLFPENFAEYKFIIKPNMNVKDEIDAGYISSGEDMQSAGEYLVEGVENVYATAFYLGLEIRSYQYKVSNEKSYLFINDFSHPFHKIDVEQNKLIDEYWDHKILPSEKGTLFPSSILNVKCGVWINKACDMEKLNKAYEKIINTPQDEINKIIDIAISVLQSIECNTDSPDNTCEFSDHYQYMNHDVKAILSGNHESIKSLLTDVEL